MSGSFISGNSNYIEGMDLSGWDVSKVTECNGLTIILMHIIGQNLKDLISQTVIQIRQRICLNLVSFFCHF